MERTIQLDKGPDTTPVESGARDTAALPVPRSRTRRLLGWSPVVIAVLGVLIAAFLVLRPSSGSPGLVGKPAPDFTLTTTNGSTIHLAALRGHPVLLNFWGVSCPPCRREVPLLQQAYARYLASGLIVLGVDAQGDGAQAVSVFAAERGVSYPMLLDPRGSVGPQYGVQDLPQSFFIDRNGVVREADPSPFVEPGPLQQAIAKIL